MNTQARHLILELSGCKPEFLENIGLVEKFMVQGAIHANAEVRESAFHKFSPQGVSGVVVIAESHLSIHTWPEYGYCAVDIYTCGDTTTPDKACFYLAGEFQATDIFLSEIKRGIPAPGNRFFHQIGRLTASIGESPD